VPRTEETTPAGAADGWVPDIGLIPAPVAPPRGPWREPPPTAEAGEAGEAPLQSAAVDRDPSVGGDVAVGGDEIVVGRGDRPAAATDRQDGDDPGRNRDAVRHAGYAGWLEPAGTSAPAAGGQDRETGAARPSDLADPAGVGADDAGVPIVPAGVPIVPSAATGPVPAGTEPARAWFGYGQTPPRPPFPPPGEAAEPASPEGSGPSADDLPVRVQPPLPPGPLPVPVVYDPPPAPRPVPAPPVPRAFQTFHDDGLGLSGSFPSTGPHQSRSLASLASGEGFAAAWWRGMELAGRGVLAPVPATRLDGRRVLVGGFGGGSGRTTVAAGLGIALAARRGGRVAAVDACPEQGGPLADRAGVPGRGVGLRELAATDPPVVSLAEARRFLGMVRPQGLEVLPGLRDLTGPGLTAAEAAWAVDLLERLFPAVIVDGPPGWTQPVPAVLLARADTVVLTARAGLTEAGCAQDALTALAAARADLPAGAIVVHVETAPPSAAGSASLMRRDSHGPRGRASRRGAGHEPAEELLEPVHAVLTVPFDPALADGAPVHWDRLHPRTRAAFEALAAAVDEAPIGPAASSGRAGTAGGSVSGDHGGDLAGPRSQAPRARRDAPALGPNR